MGECPKGNGRCLQLGSYPLLELYCEVDVVVEMLWKVATSLKVNEIEVTVSYEDLVPNATWDAPFTEPWRVDQGVPDTDKGLSGLLVSNELTDNITESGHPFRIGIGVESIGFHHGVPNLLEASPGIPGI